MVMVVYRVTFVMIRTTNYSTNRKLSRDYINYLVLNEKQKGVCRWTHPLSMYICLFVALSDKCYPSEGTALPCPQIFTFTPVNHVRGVAGP